MADEDTQLAQTIKESKDRILGEITPEKMSQAVDRVTGNDRDGNGRYNHDEAVNLITLDAKVLGREEKNAIAAACEMAGHDSVSGREVKSMLDNIAGAMLPSMEIQRTLAQAIEKGDTEKLEEGYKAALSAIFHKITPEGVQLPPKAAAATNDLTESAARKNVQVLQDNPNIRQAYINMPDISELGRLRADDLCTAATGKGIGRQT